MASYLPRIENSQIGGDYYIESEEKQNTSVISIRTFKVSLEYQLSRQGYRMQFNIKLSQTGHVHKHMHGVLKCWQSYKKKLKVCLLIIYRRKVG